MGPGDRPFQTRRGVSLPVVVLICALSLVALLLAGCDLQAQASPSPKYYPVIHAPSPTQSPTPLPLSYTVGVWPSDFTPREGRPVTVYVAFRNAGIPVAGAGVSVRVQYVTGWETFGPSATNDAGYAAFVVPSHVQPPARPIVVNATVVYQGQSYTGTSVFATMPG